MAPGVRLSRRQLGQKMTSDRSRSQAATKRRPEIELAWHRAKLSGLDPGMDVRETAISDVEKRSSLSIAAGPVLDEMVDELADTRFSILLADRTSRIIDRRVNNRASGVALDRVLAVPGFQYLEELSGTNSLATTFELRRPISVTGEEHFLEALRCFCCYGAPIIHPVTHRLEGVIDISGPVADATTLLGPYLMRATRGIEQRLLEGSRVAEKQLLAEFQAHGSRRHAVLALGEDMVLANTAAVDLVKGADHVALRAIAADLSTHSPYECSLMLTSGTEVSVRGRLIAGTLGGALFEIVETPGAGTSRPSGARPARTVAVTSDELSTQEQARTILVTGEPGTGRTTTARTLGGAECAVFDAADSIVDEEKWFLDVRSALLGDKPVVIDNVDALNSRLAGLLTSPVRISRNPVVLTGAPLSALDDPQRALTSLALTRHDLQPLRTYPHKLAAVVKSLLADLIPDSTLDIAPSALQLLAAQPWPGNLRELRAVLEHAARGRERGTIVETDLPEAVRTNSVPHRTLTLLESAERDAIVAALRATNGNRAAAAAELGIGRTTLYARLRRYRISDPCNQPGVRNRKSSAGR